MNTFFSLSLIGAAAAFSSQQALTHLNFQEWQEHHSIKFDTHHEYRLREQIFNDNKDFAIAHNLKYQSGEESYHLALNKFAHLTNEEFLEQYTLPYRNVNSDSDDDEEDPAMISHYQCPEVYTGEDHDNAWDGHDHNQVTVVKDQGSCGSCWAFGAGASMEGAMCKGGMFDCNNWNGLSTQQLVDCASGNSALNPYGNNGCNGGWQSNAMRYVSDFSHGIQAWDDYKYRAKEYLCAYDSNKSVGTIAKCGKIQGGNRQDNTVSAIQNRGILTIAIDASGRAFQMYNGGVYTGSGQCTTC